MNQFPPPRQYYNEYTPLVNREYFYVYRQNDSLLERLRRSILFILIFCLSAILFFFLFSFLIQLIFQFERESYPYYLFTRRWPPTVCQEADKCIPDIGKYQRWTIHGLWPEFSNNTWNQYCKNVTFNVDKINSLRAELEQNWPNLLEHKTPESLWKHEWEKHGTCSILNEFDYFFKTLNLNKRYDIDKWLNEAGILPHPTRQYHLQEFYNVIRQHFDPASVVINCERRNHKQYVNEIMFCISFSDAITPMDCTVKSTCHGPFYYTGLK